MLLRSISYSQFDDKPDKSWRLDTLELGQINLLVAKNASGKTRILTITYALCACWQENSSRRLHPAITMWSLTMTAQPWSIR